MVIKDTFALLKGAPNILQLSNSEIKKYSIDNGPRKVFVVLELNKNRINHFSKEKVYSMISNLEKRKQVAVVNIPEYNLHVSYNKPTKQIVLNLSPFNVDDIYSTEPDPKNLYTQMVYGILFSNLVTNKINIKDSYYAPISGFLLSMLIGLFGKQYGLLATYSNRITELNFLINCYILSAFFGIVGKKSYRLAGASSGFNFSEIEEDLNKYNFSNIEDFIKALSNFEVMSGIDKYSFLNKTYRITGLSFIPALEDLSRFISIMVCISMKGSNLINTFISKYNEDSFARIIEISKLIFKK
jgi:hypothetical protein